MNAEYLELTREFRNANTTMMILVVIVVVCAIAMWALVCILLSRWQKEPPEYNYYFDTQIKRKS